MKKSIKTLAMVLGIAIALIVVLAVVLPFIIDPNQYKDELTKLVKERTGRELKIEGKLGLSVFPWLGLTTQQLELSNAPGFGPEPFAKIESSGVKVKLLPLLRKEVIVDTVMLKGLKLSLAKNAKGQANWDGLVAPAAKPSADKPAQPSAAPPVAALTIGKLDIRDADVTWRDQQAGSAYAVRKLNLETGPVAQAKPVNARLSFDLETGQPPVRTRVDLKTTFSADLAKQALNVSDLQLNIGGMTLKAQLKGTQILDAPAVTGRVDIARFDLRSLLKKLGLTYEPADSNALNHFALGTQLVYGSNALQLKGIGITLDDSQLTGNLELRNFAKPMYKFDLALNQIDLDRYLPAATDKAAKSGDAKAIVIPLALLRDLDVQGKMRVQKLKALGIRSEEVVLQVNANAGRIVLGPNQAKLYKGQYHGRTTIEARTSPPRFQFEEQLGGVELGPLLKDADLFNKYSGTGDLDIKLTSQGMDADQLKRSLNGTVVVKLRNGKIEGVNLQKMINDARGAYDQLRGRSVKTTPQATDETAFTELTATARLTDGLARNDDLRLTGPVVRAIGQGTADLAKEILDYRLNVTLTEEAGRQGTSVPVHVGGTFAKPEYRVDIGEVLKEKAEKSLEKKLDKKLDQKLDKWRQKLPR